MPQLENQRAIITGGAGGIGRAIAHLFAAEGATVALLDLATAEGDPVAQAINESGGQARFFPCDITQESSVAGAMQAVDAWFGNPTLLVNAIGILRQGTVDEMTETDWDAIFDVNVKGIFLAIKHAIPGLKAAKGGAIVNLSSVSAFVGSTGSFAYTATKGAVLSMTYGLAQELAPFDIRVTALCPGWVDAGFTHQALRDAADPALLHAAARDAHVLGRMATPEEIAQGALFLASPAASFVTGTALFVDGGFMIKR